MPTHFHFLFRVGALLCCLLFSPSIYGQTRGADDSDQRSLTYFWPEIEAARQQHHTGKLKALLNNRRKESAGWDDRKWAVYHLLVAHQALPFLELDTARHHLELGDKLVNRHPEWESLNWRYALHWGTYHYFGGDVLEGMLIMEELIEKLNAAQTAPHEFLVLTRTSLVMMMRNLQLTYESGNQLRLGRLELKSWEKALASAGREPNAFERKTMALFYKELTAWYNAQDNKFQELDRKALTPVTFKDSTRKYLELAFSFLPEEDTLGQMAFLSLQSSMEEGGDLEKMKASIDRIFYLAGFYPNRVPVNLIAAWGQLSAYAAWHKPPLTELGLKASRESVRLNNELIGPDFFETARPLFMQAFHLYKKGPKSIAEMNEVLAYLRKAIQQLTPDTLSAEPEALPDPDRIMDTRAYLKILDLRTKAYYLRQQMIRDTVGFYKVARQIDAFIDLTENYFQHASSREELEGFYREYFTIPLLGQDVYFHLFYYYGGWENWERAMALAQMDQAILLKQEQLSKIGMHNEGIHDTTLQQVTGLRKRLQFLKNQQRNLPAEVEEARRHRLEQGIVDTEFQIKALLSEKAFFEKALSASGQVSANLTVEKIRSEILAPNQGLVAWSFLPRYGGFTFVLTQDSLWIMPWRDDQGAISNPLQAIQTEMKSWGSDGLGDDSVFIEKSTALYQLLWEPVEKITGKLPPRMLVLTNYRLGHIPFHLLLQDKPEPGQLYAQWSFLGKRVAFSFAPGLEAALLQKARPTYQKGGFVGFAPAFAGVNAGPVASRGSSREKLVPLSYNQEEVQAISHHFQQSQLLLGEEASVENLVSSWENARFIHLATHAITDLDDPGQSFLAGSNVTTAGAAARLPIAELYPFDLGAELVVLSGCGTQQGKEFYGEGIASLAQAFYKMGAQSVLSTYWSVDDKSTRQWMEYYYQGLSQGLPRDSAVQHANLQYLEHANPMYSHPYYWGAFNLLGEAGPVQLNPPAGSAWWKWGLGVLLLLLIGWMGWQYTSGRQA
ncbi:MAG: CHAT domain-containing protein [Bacteroidota bacterium]